MSQNPKPFTLTNNNISHDTVSALRQLLDEAEKGELIGISFAAMLKRRKCIVDTTGECFRNPLFALGTIKMLSMYVAEQAVRQIE